VLDPPGYSHRLGWLSLAAYNELSITDSLAREAGLQRVGGGRLGWLGCFRERSGRAGFRARGSVIYDSMHDDDLTQALAKISRTRNGHRSDKSREVGVSSSSIAIAADPGCPLLVELRMCHDEAVSGLSYGTDQPPSFDQILARIDVNQALFDIR